ncbi:MAG: hypothetical protein HY866_07300 [Chloroflexi bacterium]|nr:hypothetical protein [Chloroflexota bacterium]
MIQPGDAHAVQPPSRFGVVEAYYRPGDALDLNAGWERIIFDWSLFQPNSPDDFITETVPSEWLRQAQLAGREVVGLLKNAPNWATGSSLLGAPPRGLDLPIDDPNNHWAAFVKRAVGYYGEQWNIHHWIIYNEPDLRPGEISWYEFDGDVNDYYQILKTAYLAARSVDPQAMIHVAGMAWWTDKAAGRPPYLQRLLEVAVQDPDALDHDYFFDGVMVHVYFKPQNVWNVIVETQGILWKYGLEEKSLWLDETNARPSVDPLVVLPASLAYDISLDQQAAFVVQAAALSLAAHVERFAVYRLYDDHFVPGQSEPWGLVRFDGSRRPAFESYRTAIKYFSDTEYGQWVHSTNSSLVTLIQPRQTVYVMWARRQKPVTVWIAALLDIETVTLIEVNGASRTLTPIPRKGFSGWWYAIDAPAAVPDRNGEVLVEGTPFIVVAGGPPRPVWVQVEDTDWQLR